MILLFVLINLLVGSAMCACFDTEDQVFYKWYSEDPTGGVIGFCMLSLWPVMIYLMVQYKRQHE